MTELEAMQLLVKCRELGITREDVLALVEKSKQEKPEVKEPSDLEIREAFGDIPMSDDEILYYSTPHYDQIQAEKKAKEEKLSGKA